MCHVLKSDFEEHFPVIEKCIQDALFIAVDTEFTGLTTDTAEKSSLFDSGAERYDKIRRNVSQIIICQIGLSVFLKSSTARSYEACTFSFYLFPDSFGRVNPGFWSQASSLRFLAKHGFDFNKFVTEGVSFMNDVQERQLIEEIEQGSLFTGLDREVDELLLQQFCSQVAEWSVTTKVEENLTLQCTKDIPCYFVLRELQTRFPSLVIYSNESDQIIVEKPQQTSVKNEHQPASTKQICDNVKQREELKILNSMLGFTRIFRLLVKHKKPIIGHNMFMDLMLMYDKFYKPLPAKYDQFKADVHSMFPSIYDTKHVVSCLRKPLDDTGLLESTNLSAVYNQLSSKKGLFIVLYSPEIKHAEGFNNYDNNEHPHEAGFDAYMAGSVFIRLAHVGGLYGIKSTKSRPLQFHDYLQVVAPYKNHVNLIRAAIDHLSFEGNDPVSRRPQWLLVRCKKSQWKLNSVELAQQFSPYGSVDIRLQNYRQGLVAVGNFRCAKDILKAFKNHDRFYVTKYSTLKHSPVVRGLLWSGLAVSGGLLLFAMFSQNKDKSVV